jgi:hypothetical protein
MRAKVSGIPHGDLSGLPNLTGLFSSAPETRQVLET